MCDLSIIVLLADGTGKMISHRGAVVFFVVLNFLAKGYGLGLYLRAQYAINFTPNPDEHAIERYLYEAQLYMCQQILPVPRLLSKYEQLRSQAYIKGVQQVTNHFC